MKIYLIDGSLESILCAVFEWFERKPGKVRLVRQSEYRPDAFSEILEIVNRRDSADRVWKGLKNKLPAVWMRRVYCTFLSELPEAPQLLFDFACYIFSAGKGTGGKNTAAAHAYRADDPENNYGHPAVLGIAQVAVKVEREKHRMEAFIRFKQVQNDRQEAQKGAMHSRDGLYYCVIEPDFNVIPLIAKHFRDRYADQCWLIYDLRRHYGIHYDLQNTQEVSLDREAERGLLKQAGTSAPEAETQHTELWRHYFRSTNIKARKNTKLFMRHVPKRYWRYLTEI